MTQPMTEKRLSEIKETYQMVKAENTSVYHPFLGDCLTEIERLQNVEAALEDMCYQFGGWHDKKGGLMTNGLSVLEYAFGVLGWNEPHPVPAMECDEPGCHKQRSCGWPSKTGYRNTCGEHYTGF